MFSNLAGLLRSAADRLSPEGVADDSAGFLLSHDDLQAQRQADALSLMDSEVHGYVMVQLRDRGDGTLILEHQYVMPNPAWPMVNRLLVEIASEPSG